MAKRQAARTKKSDRFLVDKVSGEYEKPGPKLNEEASRLSGFIAQISRRENVGWVENWVPPWLNGENVPPFDFYFFEVGLAVDAFGLDKTEVDYLSSSYTAQEQAEIGKKQALCSQHGVAYLYLSPEDNPDRVQVAAKLGMTTHRSDAGVAGRT